MFSATFAYEVEEWCRLNLDNLVQVYIGAKNSAITTIKQELIFVGSESGKLIALRDIVRKVSSYSQSLVLVHVVFSHYVNHSFSYTFATFFVAIYLTHI